jgi:hypothetical protein
VRAVDQRTATELSSTVEQSRLDACANVRGSRPRPGIRVWRELTKGINMEQSAVLSFVSAV